MANDKLKKYLRTRAILSPWMIEGTRRTDFSAAIVIPALAEAGSLPGTLEALTVNPRESLQQTLVLVVVNNRSDISDEQLRDNQQTLDWFRSAPFAQLNLAWVDASSPGKELPARQGVGLARKIGFDLALRRLAWKQRPVLISLDADTQVDENYLPAIFKHFSRSQKGAATLPFRHQPGETPEQEAAIRRYELYLRSYLFGLQRAGSPYAHHTIGSAFTCTAEAYAAAGGMNRRQAAEDFYFLQQLAKTSGVELLHGTVVQPSPRCSARVPFGTGTAVQGQVEQGRELFRFASATAFGLLQDWLRAVEHGWGASAEDLLQQARQLSPVLSTFLAELRFSHNWQKLQANHNGRQQRIAAFHAWFDGLRTRQLLARLDVDTELAVPELIAELLAWGGCPEGRCGAEPLAILEKMQGVG